MPLGQIPPELYPKGGDEVTKCGYAFERGWFRAQRLFQQYIVDAAATYDQNRLNWVYHNQSADRYQGLADAFDATDGDTALGFAPGGRSRSISLTSI
jgi:hypothetical protein